MRKFGLALSGGGFRATLFHLGLVRYLYEARLLSDVNHITSVSGGSIIAAHLALNWDRYIGTNEQFQEAASELLAFIRLDVRNRILRRYPLAFPLRVARRLAGLSNRQLTRPGLLEYHYEKYLFGDTSLFQLPQAPCLNLLATNLSEGRLCAFNREGLWMIRRGGHTVRIDQVPISLATVPMAVAASSAFPGFFPPMMLTGADVGAKDGEFGRQAYTDGGVFDNLGVRMFRYLMQAADSDRVPWDAVLVSDAGRPFEVRNTRRAGGLVRTAMRATDILMDRVWQLETETFKDAADFVFARITAIVDPDEDPSALHPAVQQQLPNIRTDLDRFSDDEICALVRHGYCVARKACRTLPQVFRESVTEQPAWMPTSEKAAGLVPVAISTTADLQDRGSTEIGPLTSAQPTSAIRRFWRGLFGGRDPMGPKIGCGATADPVVRLRQRDPIEATLSARTLHASASRRIWGTLLDHRDWVSYVYVPVIVPILILAPYLAIKAYERTHRINQIVESLSQSSRDLEQMTRLVDGPIAPFVGDKDQGLPPDTSLVGFTILQDLRIIDLRGWNPATSGGSQADSFVYGYRRLKVRKEPENYSNFFHANVLALSPNTQVRFPPQQLTPKLYSSPLTINGQASKLRQYEIGADFKRVPTGEPVDIIYEHSSPGLFLREGIESTMLTFAVEAETIELSRWLLMPTGREYRSFTMVRYPTGKPLEVEIVKPVTEFRANDYTILAFKLLALRKGYTYELTWYYK